LALAGLELRTLEQRRPTLGFLSERDANGVVVVKTVDPDGSAAVSGLRVDDGIIEWNGADVPRGVDHWLREQKAGDLLKLRVRREDKELNIEFRLGEFKETFYEVIEASHPSEKARHIRDGILHGTTSAAPGH
jgi:predicted metalloprotease with PDZ domain